MISEIPASAFEIPQYALWMIGGWVLTTLITGWLSYRSGLRSQRYAELLKAKNAAFAEIDQIRSVIAAADNLRTVLLTGQRRLEKLVFAVSSQLHCQNRRTRIETAWADYQKLKIDEFPVSAASAEARARMSQPLIRLRDEMSHT